MRFKKIPEVYCCEEKKLKHYKSFTRRKAITLNNKPILNKLSVFQDRSRSFYPCHIALFGGFIVRYVFARCLGKEFKTCFYMCSYPALFRADQMKNHFGLNTRPIQDKLPDGLIMVHHFPKDT